MADEAVTGITLSATDAGGADVLVDTEGAQSIASGDVGVVTIRDTADHYVFTAYCASATTLVIQAGDSPIAVRKGLGARTITIPAGDCIPFVVEAARHMQDNGTFRFTAGATAVILSALRIPNTV